MLLQPARFDLPRLPSTISGLKLWLKADGALWQDAARTVPAASNGDVVGAWDDASGTGNHVTQATTAKKPTLRTGVVGGKPVIRFDGSNDTLVSVAASGTDTSSFTQFAVLKRANTASGDILHTGLTSAGGNMEWYAWATGNVQRTDTENTTGLVVGTNSLGTSAFHTLGISSENVAPDTPTEIASTSTYDAFGVMLRMTTGTLMYVYRQGSSHFGPGDYGVIRARTSTDDGATWSAATTIASEASVDLRNVGGGVTSTGRLVVFFTRYQPDGSPTWLSMERIYSDDNGGTWSTSLPLDTGPYAWTIFSTYGAMITTDNGKLLMSWYGNTASTYYCLAATSDDNGANWSAPIVVISGAAAGSSNSKYTEWCAVSLGAGAVLGLVRADNGTAFTQVISQDNGLTWTSLGLTTFDTWSSASPNTPPWLTRVGSRVFVYYSQRTAKEFRVASATRCGLHSSVAGWSNRNTLFAPGVIDIGYPSVVVLPSDRQVGIGYWGKSTSDADLYSFTWPMPGTAFLNGSYDGVGGTRRTFNTGPNVWVGSEQGIAQWISGDIAEIIRFNRALTIAEINSVGLYLAAKYGTTWVGV